MQTTTLHLFTSELVTFGSFHSHCRETGTLMVNLSFPKGIALWRCSFLPIEWKLVFSDLYRCRYSTPKLKKKSNETDFNLGLLSFVGSFTPAV